MPTRIIFAAQGKDDKPLGLNVAQTSGEVLAGVTDAKGQPFALARAGNGEQVYVNPKMVAYFEEVTGGKKAAGATP